ncbi:MAG: methyltransferase [Verrucomicrobia bacterium]|nr:MAG: methyltransferase [Verrucomicrobiota bacterium]
MQFAWGFAPTFILNSAVELRLFDYLENGPRTVEQLANETQCSARGLTALLDALVGFQFLRRKGNAYALTPETSTFLVSTKPDYHGGFFRQVTGQVMPDWMDLTEAVRTGQPAKKVNEQEGGAEFFAELVEGIFPMSYRAAEALGRHLQLGKLSEPVTVLDIGAGSGVWGIALAQQSPHVSIVAVDWPKVLEVTRRIVERHGLGGRFRTSPGDFRQADFGSGHRLATIGHILHSEGRERSRQLLQKVFDALSPGGTVAIAEFIPNEDRTGPPNALMFAVNMLLHTTEGDTFTFREISAWLREAGFRNVRLLEAPAPSPLVLATKPRFRH